MAEESEFRIEDLPRDTLHSGISRVLNYEIAMLLAASDRWFVDAIPYPIQANNADPRMRSALVEGFATRYRNLFEFLGYGAK
jgi:hypothetical protein